MITSAPLASSHRPSTTVVAVDSTFAPDAFTRASSSGEGNPKWKLTTGGRKSSMTPAISASNGRLGLPGLRDGVNAELPVVGREPGEPSGFTPDVGRGWGMTEEVEVERPVRSCSNRGNLSPHPIGVKHRARNRAKPTRSRNRSSKCAPLRTGHRRLHHRKLETQAPLEELPRHAPSEDDGTPPAATLVVGLTGEWS